MAINPLPVDHHAATLGRLAAELNMPVEAFLSDLPDGDAGELLTLMRLWSAIEDGQGRRRVLSLARVEAERAGYGERPPGYPPSIPEPDAASAGRRDEPPCRCPGTETAGP